MLDHGRIIDSGEPKDVVDFYQNMMLKKMHQGDMPVQVKKIEKERKVNNSSISTGEVELVSFKILNEKGEEISYIESENIINIVYEVKALKDLDEPHYGLMIRNNFGLSIFETNTYCMHQIPEKICRDQIVKTTWKMNCPLAPGTYSFSIGVANKGQNLGSFEEYLLLVHDINMLKVLSKKEGMIFAGIFNMKPHVFID